jgi:acyl-CoA thioesterase-1
LNGIIDLKPDIVILEIGANDGFQRVPPKIMQQNIDLIVTTLRENRITVVLAGMKLFPSAGFVIKEEFAAVYPAVAKKHRATLLPFFLDGVAGVTSLNLEDGIHPNGEGYRVIMENIFPYVVKAIKQKDER